MKPGVLEGIVVLDFTRAVAGAYATRLLADMGARVIKIEAPGGEGLRNTTIDDPRVAKSMPPTLSPMFIYSNAGKQSVCMDLKKQESVEIIKRLVTRVDVVAENFTPHVMPGLGLSYKELSSIKPDLVMCSLTGYGQEGPLAEATATDYMAQAMGGMAYLTGEPNGYPTPAQNGIGDTVSGTVAALAIVSALLRRQTSGEGEYIDISMADSVMSMDCTAHPIFAATRGEYAMTRGGRDHFLLSPWGTFKGPKGRYFNIQGDWGRISKLMGRPELAERPEFNTPRARLANKDLIRDLIEEFIGRFESEDAVLEAFRGARISIAPVLDPWEAQNHPQIAGREMVREVEYPDGRIVPTIATAPRFRNRPINVGRAPLIGEHTREVMREFLGLSQAEIAQLYSAGALHEHESVKALPARAEGAVRGGRE